MSRMKPIPAARSRWLLCLLLLMPVGCGSSPLSVEQEQVRHDREQAVASLSTVGVIGASTSAGFGSGVSLGTLIRAGLKLPVRVVERPDVMFFRDPAGVGRAQIDFLEAQHATTVVALDYLFWFAYGHGTFEQRRLRLEQGLKLLDRLSAEVLLVGDLPDMTGASPLFLAASAIPAPDQLVRLNQMIYHWAQSRERVTLLAVADLVGAIKNGDPVEVAGEQLQVTPEEVLLNDRLHANRRGQVLIARLCLERLRDALPGLRASDLTSDGDEIEQIVADRDVHG